jgi:hypothetical protein
VIWLRRATAFLLLAFVVASVVTLVAKEVTHREPAEPSVRIVPLATDPGSADGTCRIVACYFHNTDRCSTCLEIERTAREVVEKTFSAELASGQLTWVALNMEEEENRAYIAQFDLAMPTLVVLRVKGGVVEDWAPLANTWGLIRNAARFSMYVTDNVRRYLEGCS